MPKLCPHTGKDDCDMCDSFCILQQAENEEAASSIVEESSALDADARAKRTVEAGG